MKLHLRLVAVALLCAFFTTAIGAVSFLALEAIGGSITVNYGFLNATSAILVVGALIFLTSIPIAYYASTYGVDIDLLTRGAGFGYIGSTVSTSSNRSAMTVESASMKCARSFGSMPGVSGIRQPKR